MARATTRCPECGVGWDGAATFCGRCGAVLGDDRPGLGRWSRTEPAATDRPRRSLLTLTLAVTVLTVGAVAVLGPWSEPAPSAPDGDVALPVTAAADPPLRIDRSGPGAASATPSCTVGDRTVPCIEWSQAVATGVAAVGSDLVVVAGGASVGAYDLTSGEPRWFADVGAGVAPLALASGVALVQDLDGVTALAGDDGRVVWSADGLAPLPGAEPRAGRLLMVGDGDAGRLAAVDVRTGRIVERGPREPRSGRAQVTSGLAVLHDRDAGTVGAWAPGDGGRMRWVRPTRAARVWAVAADDTAVYVHEDPRSDSPAHVVARDIATGAPRWSVPADAAGAVVAGGVLVTVGADRRALQGIDVRTGAVRWVRDDTGTAQLLGPLAPDARDGTVLVTDRDPGDAAVTVALLDAVTGATQWQHRTVEVPWGGRVSGDLVLLWDRHRLQVLDRDSGRHVGTAGISNTAPLSFDPLVVVGLRHVHHVDRAVFASPPVASPEG